MEVAEATFSRSSSNIVFAYSVIGRSHEKSRKPCQDSSLCCHESDEKFTYITVADGHGGDQYFRSDLGSRFAIEAGRECLTNGAARKALTDLCPKKDDALLIQKGKGRDRLILQLKERIIGRWNVLVREHYENHPFLDTELNHIPEKYAERYRKNEIIESAYGSTLIAVLWTDTFMLALQIGDGNCVVVDSDGNFTQPIPEDEKCFLNMTTSLCDTEAINAFRHHFTQRHPIALIIGTDGITDSFAGDKGLYNFYRLILISFSQNDNDSEESEKLHDYLPRLSQKGSGDDVSIAMIANRELLRNIDFSVPEETVQEQQVQGNIHITHVVAELQENENDGITGSDMDKPPSDLETVANAAVDIIMGIEVGDMQNKDR